MGEDATLRLALTGDSIVQRKLRTHEDKVLRPLFDLIREADIAFTNLEVVPNDFVGDPVLECGGLHLGAPAWVLDELQEAGFNLFAMATNHSLDYGVTGLLKSVQALRERGLVYAGIGPNLEEARRPAYFTHHNGTVALLSCTTTFSPGQEASAQRPDMVGRPGLNPLRYRMVCEVTSTQLAAISEMAEQLGLEQLRQRFIQLGFAHSPDDPSAVPFWNLQFRAAPQPALRLLARASDIDDIARWVREARESSDVVLVSVHSHEWVMDEERPAEFLPSFAHRMIDEGASLVVGHGPHLLRGMEIYNGCPIFYSLGNFIGQNELVPRLPADSFERLRAQPQMTPGKIFRQRSENDSKGFPAERRFWETIVPICNFSHGRLTQIEFYPVSLGLGESRHMRGRPRLATDEDGSAILNRFARLSAPFGVRLKACGASSTLTI